MAGCRRGLCLCLLLALAGPGRALQNVTAQLFGAEAYGTLAAFGDFNSDKQTDLFVLRGGERGGTGGGRRPYRRRSGGGRERSRRVPGAAAGVSLLASGARVAEARSRFPVGACGDRGRPATSYGRGPCPDGRRASAGPPCRGLPLALPAGAVLAGRHRLPEREALCARERLSWWELPCEEQGAGLGGPCGSFLGPLPWGHRAGPGAVPRPPVSSPVCSLRVCSVVRAAAASNNVTVKIKTDIHIAPEIFPV